VQVGATASVSIVDTSVTPPPQVSVIATANGKETDGSPVVFTFTRAGSTAAVLSINYQLFGTAKAGSDYTGNTSGSVSFAAGSATATLSLPALADGALIDPGETIIARINPASTYGITTGKQFATAKITAEGMVVVPKGQTRPGASSGEKGNWFAFAVLKSDGSVISWGDSIYGGSAPIGLTGVSQIFSTLYAFAALKSDGSVVTWGSSGNGGIAPAGLKGVSQIFSTVRAFAALKTDGSVVSWGRDHDYKTITAPQGLTGVSQIFSTDFAFAALKSDGNVECWGTYFDGSQYSSLKAPAGLTGVIQIFSTNDAFAALKSDGSVISWGDSGYGGSAPAGLTGVSQIFSTNDAFAALKYDGTVVTWGDNYSGGIAPMGLTGVTQIFSTNYAFAALKNDGSVISWGGDDSRAPAGLTGVNQIFSTALAFAALKSDGSVVCWGNSKYGGSAPSGLTGVSQIFSTGYAFAALKSDGSVVCWGDNDYGGSAPTGIKGVSQIFSTNKAFAALKSDGSVISWGSDSFKAIAAPAGLTDVVGFANPYTDDRLILEDKLTPTYTLTPSATTINEGSTLSTSVATTNVAPGTTLYYSLSGTGINAADFSTGALTGSGTVGTDGKLSISHTLANDLTTEGAETLNIKLFSDSSRTTQVGSTASVAIVDTSTNTDDHLIIDRADLAANIISGRATQNYYNEGYVSSFKNQELIKYYVHDEVTLIAEETYSWTHWDGHEWFIDDLFLELDPHIDLDFIKTTDQSKAHIEVWRLSPTSPIVADEGMLGIGASYSFLNDTFGLDLEAKDFGGYQLAAWAMPSEDNSAFVNDYDIARYDSLHTIIHEIGHVLGLSHPQHDGSDDPYGDWHSASDTVMSYNGNPIKISANSSYVREPMWTIDDIAALKLIWGDENDLNPHQVTYSLNISATSINEGATLTTSVATTNVASGATLYYTLSGNGITVADFSAGSLTGEGIIDATGKFTFTHTLANDLLTEGAETVEIKLFSDDARKVQVGSTATVAIQDTSTQLLSIEKQGSVELLADASNNVMVKSSAGSFQLKRSGWGDLKQDRGGWKITAAETINSKNYVLDRSDAMVYVWEMDNNWNFLRDSQSAKPGQAEFYQIETNFGVDLNRDGITGMPAATSIEKQGSVELLADASNNVMVKSSAGSFQLKRSGWGDLKQDRGGWKITAAETINSKNYVLDRSDAMVYVWEMDNNWNFLRDSQSAKPGQAEFYQIETNFGVDLNRDGITGMPAATSIEKQGSVELLADASNNVMVKSSAGSFQLKRSGWGDLKQDRGGWKITAAETINSKNYVLDRSDAMVYVWEMDNNWNFLRDSQSAKPGQAEFYQIETNFGVDLNRDGITGMPAATSIEKQGSVELLADASNNVMVKSSAGSFQLKRSGWGDLKQDRGGWKITAAETINSKNYVLDRSDAMVYVWEMDNNWNFLRDSQSAKPGQAEFYQIETNFGVDLNRDGITGMPAATSIEKQGSVELLADASNNVMVKSSAGSFQLKRSGWGDLKQDRGGWKITAAETINSKNYVLDRSDAMVYVWEMDNNWNFLRDSQSAKPGQAEFYQIETNFGVDLNRDGITGMPAATSIEKQGSVELLADASNNVMVKSSAGSFQLKRSGWGDLKQDRGGWKITAAETINSKNYVLDRSDAMVYVWEMDNNWNFLRDSQSAKPGQAEFYQIETNFGVDLNRDGITGMPAATSIEKQGSVELLADASNNVMVKSSAGSFQLKRSGWGDLKQDRGGWKITAAETINSKNYVLDRSDAMVYVWEMDNNWNFLRDSQSAKPGQAEFYQIETNFGVDLNRDGVTGIPSNTKSALMMF
jgi:hypothetical protein